MKISEVFQISVAKSKGTDDYLSGNTPFVTNTEVNNGIVKYVDPFDDDRICHGPAICISGLGHATVHFGEFLPKGNGGDSCTILKPKVKLKNNELIYYAALFNTLHGWRFSFGRKASKRRVEGLVLEPSHLEPPIDIDREIELNNTLMLTLLKKKEAELK
jgi:hypothetical protein